ncbi:class I SAM-dependent methyltransferase [bacterium]|nr:class I SAM-dependent methyltransferase [bacterium]
MPFSPLPGICNARLDALAAVGGACALDLGCGDGLLGALCSRPGLPVFGLDRLGPLRGDQVHIVGDARGLPFPRSSLDLLLAGNLVRHLLVQDPDLAFLDHWESVLRPGGTLLILEDQPGAGSPASRNYRYLQDLLAGLDPRRRGPLVTVQTFRSLLKERPWVTDAPWGLAPNRWPADSGAVATMLAAGSPAESGPVAGLLRSLERHGLEYGDFWWLMATKETRR